MNEEQARQYYIKIKTLREHAQKLTNQINQLDNQTVQIREMIKAVTDVQDVPEGSDILAQVTQGVMIEAISKPVEKVFLNVGAGTVVEKSPADAIELLEEQQRELAEFRKNLIAQRKDVNAQAQKIEQEVEESIDV